MKRTDALDSGTAVAMDALGRALQQGDTLIPQMGRMQTEELGRRPCEIANGADPRILRVTRLPPNPLAVAYVYHCTRMMTPRFNESVAISCIRGNDFREFATATIRKYAQRYRDRAFAALENGDSLFKLVGGDLDRCPQIAAPLGSRSR